MLYNDPIYCADLQRAAATACPQIRGCSFLVTGATGLICSSFVDFLLAVNRSYDAGLTVFAAGRNESAVRERFGSDPAVQFVPYDALEDISFDIYADYIIHGAGNASPELYTSTPVETMLMNFSGIDGLLRYAQDHQTKRVLYISSSEVYGKKETAEPFREDEYGFVDLLNPRSSYSVSKRASETLCVSYAKEHGVDSVIVRPGHIYGPTASSRDKRISSQFAWAAAHGEKLVMKSAGTQLRSYCYCVDCAYAMLTVLLRGQPGEAYNISNSASVISIRRMAEILACAGNVTLEAAEPTAAEADAFNPMNNSALNSSKLESIGFQGLFDAETGLIHTVAVLKNIIQGSGCSNG